jgi:hypothetical protein
MLVFIKCQFGAKRVWGYCGRQNGVLYHRCPTIPQESLFFRYPEFTFFNFSLAVMQLTHHRGGVMLPPTPPGSWYTQFRPHCLVHTEDPPAHLPAPPGPNRPPGRDRPSSPLTSFYHHHGSSVPSSWRARKVRLGQRTIIYLGYPGILYRLINDDVLGPNCSGSSWRPL